MTVTAPPVAPAARRQAVRDVRRPLVAAGVTVAATVLVALRDPHVPGRYGYCPLYVLTGVYCPACGALRATHDLAHLDVAAAWSQNPLWVLLVPVVVAGWAFVVVRRVGGRPVPTVPPWAAWVALALVVVFGILRNLPAFAWMAP